MDNVRLTTELNKMRKLKDLVLKDVVAQYEAMPQHYEFEDFPYSIGCNDFVRITLYAGYGVTFYVTYSVCPMGDDMSKMDNIEFETEKYGDIDDEFDIRFSTIKAYLKGAFAPEEEDIDLDNIPTEDDMLPENEFNPKKHNDIVSIMIQTILKETTYKLTDWYFVRDIPALEFRTEQDGMDLVLKAVFTPVGVNVIQRAYFGDNMVKLQLSNTLHNQFNGISSIIYNKSYHIG